VERAQPHAGDPTFQQGLDAFAHLARRLVGEGDGEDLLGPRPTRGDDVRDAMRENARLAAAGAGEDEQRPVGRLDGATLRLVEAAQQVRGADGAQERER
jgi:hypothetical protein